MADWVGPESYWWLQPRPTQPSKIGFYAQLQQQERRDQAATALKEKDMQLENDKFGLQLGEYFNKRTLQNKTIEGNAKLSKVLADPNFKWIDPASVANIFRVGAEHPELVGTPFWQSLIQMPDKAADNERLRIAEESKATARVAQVNSLQKRLDGQLQHWENQDEAEQVALDLKQAAREGDVRRLDQIDYQLRLREQEQRFKREQFEFKQSQMSPEQKLRYQNAVKALQDEAILGKALDPKTGKRTAEEYQRRAKAIEDEFFGSGRKAAPVSPAGTPLNTKKYFNPETGQLQDTPYAPNR